MSKKAKFGLAGTILYTAATIALPVYASTQSQTTSLEHLTSSEQVKTVYDEKIKEYTADKKLKQDEIRDLNTIIGKGARLENKEHAVYKKKIDKKYYSLKETLDVVKNGKEDLLKPVYEVNVELTNEKMELGVIKKNLQVEDNHRKVYDNHKEEIQNIRADLNKLLNIYYPGLLKKDNSDYNVIYTPHVDMDYGFSGEFKKLVNRAEPIFEIVFHREDMDSFDRRSKYLKIREILMFREIINEDYEVKFDPKGYGFMMQKQLEIVAGIEQKKKQVEDELAAQVNSFDQKISNLEKEIKDVSEKMAFKHFFQYRTGLFSSYMAALEQRKDYVDGNGFDTQDYWCTSLILAEERVRGHYNDSDYNFGREVRNLEDVLAKEGFKDVDVEDITNPTRARFPLWLMWPAAAGLSALRRTVFRAYVLKRKGDPMDVIAPILMAIVGPMGLDAIHPIVFPLRNVAIPFIEEPIRKIFGWSKPINKSKW